MGKIYGREPATWMSLVAAGWGVLSAFGIGFSAETQSVVTAAIAAVLGLVVAVQVHDGLLAALNGLTVAAISLVSHFALHWSAEEQAAKVGAITLLIAWFVTRPNVTAPVPATVSPAGTLVTRDPVAQA
jgi:hypothetical protein